MVDPPSPPTDDGRQFELPIGLGAIGGENDVVEGADHRVRGAEEHERLAGFQPVVEFRTGTVTVGRRKPVGGIAACISGAHKVEHMLAVIRAGLENLAGGEERGEWVQIVQRVLELVWSEAIGERLQCGQRRVPRLEQRPEIGARVQPFSERSRAVVPDEREEWLGVLRAKRREGKRSWTGHEISLSRSFREIYPIRFLGAASKLDRRLDFDPKIGIVAETVCSRTALASTRRRKGESPVPPRLIAHLAHVEILTPRPEDSLRFFTEVLGLDETTREGQSVYLRGWGEWSHHSLQLTEAPRPGIGHIGWRAWSPEDLETAVQRVEARDAGRGWVDENIGHGPAFRFVSPGGHTHELFWEDEKYVAPPGEESPFPNRPQRYRPRGVAPRQIDHVTG
jgi:catechol 2,3-dioxygenase-like lactoylglutathione lyase family enzyme